MIKYSDRLWFRWQKTNKRKQRAATSVILSDERREGVCIRYMTERKEDADAVRYEKDK